MNRPAEAFGEFGELPVEMIQAQRWLVWKAIPQPEGKKPRKVPFYPDGTERRGTLDSPEDQSRFGTFTDACKALANGAYTGLGFALGPDGTGAHWQGVDLDDVKARPGLVTLMEIAPGYVERSPSGNGFHSIGYGQPFASLGSNATGIEAYAGGRYFTVTGDAIGGRIEDLSRFVVETLRPVHKPRVEPQNETPHTAGPEPDDLIRDLRSALWHLDADDYASWISTGLALKTLGAQGRALWLEWSSTSPKFDAADAARRWGGFEPNATDYRAIFAEAQRSGWANPKKRDRSEVTPRGEAKAANDAKAKPETLAAGALIYKDDKGTTRRIIDSQAADVVAAAMRERLAWDPNAQAWFVWSRDHWEPQTSASRADRMLSRAVRAGTHPIGYRVSYLNGVIQVIQREGKLDPPEWPQNVIPFSNGLLDLDTLKLSEARPGYALDWSLPHHYDPKATCPTILAWLLDAVEGDAETVELLRAFMAALLRRLPIQKFLHLKGPGGSGKSTLQELMIELVGILNTAISTLANLEENRFETAKLFGKRLCMVNEAGKYGGSVNMFKAATGGDHLPLERKHQQQEGSFKFDGLCVIASNDDLRTTDVTSALERRRLTVTFPKRVTIEERERWDARGGAKAVLHHEIPGLINWLMDLSPEQIRAKVARPGDRVAADNLRSLKASNPVAAWMDSCCVFDPSDDPANWGQVGTRKEYRIEGAPRFEKADAWLYPNYLTFMEEQNLKFPVSLNVFKKTVIDLALMMGHQVRDVDKHPISRGSAIAGIRIRRLGE